MNAFKSFLTAAFIACFAFGIQGQQAYVVPTNASQDEFINVYKYILKTSNDDYRNSAANSVLFGKYSEYSIYWAIDGTNAGSFIIPDALPIEYSGLNNSSLSSYTWNNGQNLSVQFKNNAKKVGILKSQYKKNDNSISWETTYFTDLFSSFLGSQCYYVFNETQCIAGISDSTDVIVIPAFTSGSGITTELIDSIAGLYGSMAGKLSMFLARGGVIYTEGNAAYLMEALGLLPDNSLDYSAPYQPGASGIVDIIAVSGNPLTLSAAANTNKLYVSALPSVNIPSATIAARLASDNRPVIFSIEGTEAHGGKIICNLGLPLVQGLYDAASKRQTQYSLDAIMYAFSKKVDVTRAVTNHLWGITMVVPDNTVSFDRVDTFNVTITVRNLSSATVSNVTIEEKIPSFLRFIGTTNGSYSNSKLNITLGSLGGNSEQTITYQLCTPDPGDPIHSAIANTLIGGSFLNTSINTTSYTLNNTREAFLKNKAYANSIFSANIVADADVNWKNFLGTYFQPFKVFTIMENKEHTAAEQTVYVQFIPRDVPFYQTDNSINIPILKTPGGKFIDVLKGVDVGLANKTNAPISNDFDADGDPDVWLDTASIYPKNYTLKDTMVYWANPWNHLRTGANDIIFDDINHDGIIARADSNGTILQDAPGDKIHVWKVTWPIGTFPGNQYYDPYCSYELWIDAPDLIALAAGVGYVNDSVPGEYDGMYYPYTANIAAADKNDTTYAHWMEKEGSEVVWKQFILQKQNNYLGYAFIDTLEENYQLRPYDSLMGTTPVPHNEFIAVVCLGGEEIDMTHYTPERSLYSNLYYKTMLGEDKITPIRTVYTYYAPLPNPLQFEYLSSSYIITDSLGNQTQTLPKNGLAQLEFNLYPSTEYTYYWIRNFGYPVLNSPLKQYDGLDGLGDGVFGYFIYDIPKGMGGYSITLPRNADGSYDIDALVEVEGNHPYQPLINNPNTPNAIEVWEDPFQYHVYIPQLLIPPALDDNDFDGADDWWDDKGDRFLSNTGFLHDAFMPGDGDTIASEYTHEDIGYGVVTTGWSHGADGAYGDDLFENLGKIKITINAQYEGFGREGNVDISKGGTFVCEEIFGGSPWVISSHVHTAFAEGTEYEISSSAVPSTVKYGGDTICIKHEISDKDEPHYFNSGFDPYIQSFGYEDASITSIAGGKDPCSFITPDISTHSIIDPAADIMSIIAYPDIPGSTKNITGAFLSVKVEVSNLSDDNWQNVSLTPVLTNAAGVTTEVEYVAYPRPLVPNDNIGDMTTGWRFNQPEGEVIVKPGNVLYEIQPTRRAYFVFVFKVPAMPQGIYEIGFTIDGEKVHYTGTNHGALSYNVPPVKFSVVDKSDLKFAKMVIGSGVLDSLYVPTSNFTGLGDAKWSAEDVDNTAFDSLTGTLPVSISGGGELIDLTGLSTLPNGDTSILYILQKGVVTVTMGSDSVRVTNPAILNFKNSSGINDTVSSNTTNIMPLGPFISITNTLYAINGERVLDTLPRSNGSEFYVVSRLNAVNIGNSPSYLSAITLYTCAGYDLLFDSISANNPYTVTATEEGLKVEFGTITPGESRQLYVYYKLKDTIDGSVDITTIINQSGIGFNDKFNFPYEYIDPTPLKLYVYEFAVNTISYTNSGDMMVSVTAVAINYGITAHNVWFRIYPVVNGGLREFPIAEINIETFLPGQTITLTGNYLVPEGQTVEFVGVIDDNNQFLELLKSNNEKTTLYDSVSNGLNDFTTEGLRIYPNPFYNWIIADIALSSDTRQVLFAVYNLNGELITTAQFAVYNGKVDVKLNLGQLIPGAYIYKAYAVGNETKVYSGFIVKQ